MLSLFLIFLTLFNANSLSYLDNNNSSFDWIDIPEESIIHEETWPYKGVGCSIETEGDDLYFVSATYPGRYTYNQGECNKSKKKVEILKYNFSSNNFTDSLLIGDTSQHPTAVGGKGSDDIVACGILPSENMLYYITANIHNCPVNYKYDSSIVRINLTTFQFIDRTLLKDIPNVPPFSDYEFNKFKYLNIPTTVELVDDYLWIGFGTRSTGVWKLKINETDIVLETSFQKKYKKQDDQMKTMGGTTNYYSVIFNEIKHSFVNKRDKLIYFLEDTGYADAQLLIINYSIPIDENNSHIQTLNGINYVSDMKFDYVSGKIYIISGSLSSEMYQYDLNFNKLQLSEGCVTDFLKFPTEWGVVTNIDIDYQTGFIYASISSRWGNNGVVSINQKDSSINTDSMLFFGMNVQYPQHSYYQWYNNMNITSLLLNKGLLVVSSNSNSYNTKIAFIKLNGCALGRGISNGKCNLCSYGKFSDRVGGICEECHPGFATNIEESHKCIKCTPGKFSIGGNAINCIECPNGFFADKEGSNRCQSCGRGKFSITMGSDNNKNCVDCDTGKISEEGSTTCEFCSKGKWSKQQKECVECPKGRYSFSVGLKVAEECLLCTIGTFGDEIGLIFENQCKECKSGYIGIIEGAVSNSSCLACEPGKFRKNIYSCSNCEEGFVANRAQNQCASCPKGKVSNIYKIKCVDCPKGTFNDIDKSYTISRCKNCIAGRYSNISGLINSDDCIKCPSGKVNLGIGASSFMDCKLCAVGKYRNYDMGIECVICATGKYSVSGSEKCEYCSPGKYVFTVDDIPSNCEDCPVGKFIVDEGGYLEDSCINCPVGKWSNTIASYSENKCIKCQPGKYSDIAGATEQSVCIDCQGGQYNSKAGSSNINDCKPCPTGSISPSGSVTCSLCERGKYSELMGATVCKLCLKGKIASNQASLICTSCPSGAEENMEKTKCSCVSGTYNENNSNIISCLSCPERFICSKGTNIQNMVIKSHFWRESKNTLKSYKCKNRFACKGGRIINYTDNLCQPGHKGPICDVCERGWSKDDGVCLKCPENIGRTISLTIAIPIICILIIIFLIKTANPANNKKEEVNGVVKIFMNYAQVFSLASSFQINWPTLIKYLFERAKEFSSPRVSFYSSDCAIGWNYYDKFIVYLTLPLVYIFMATFVIFIVSLCYCKKKRRKLVGMSESHKKIFIDKSPTCLEFFTAWEKTAIVVGTFLSWPTIVEKTLEIMNCEKIGTEYYLVKDVSVICYTNKHYNFLIVGYLGLILYGIGIPLLGFRLLYKYRFRLFDMQNRYDGSTPLSFLFLGYREKRWYYEFIIMGKKAGLILLSVFLRNHPRYQIIGASLLVQISFFVHIFLRPYDTITSYGMICNKLESVSLLSLVMTLSTGLFFGTIDSGYNLGFFEDVLIVLLLASNGLICLYFFIYFVTLTFKSIKTHLREFIVEKVTDGNTPCLFRCCSKKNIKRFRDWGDLEMVEDYGIHLKNQVEKEIFTNYFKEKQDKLGVLNDKIDNIKHRRVSIKLDRLRSQIQVMEKERCWQTIKNNRLYAELKKTVMLNKTVLEKEDLKKLNDVFNLYVEHGINYNEKINGLYMGELQDMIVHKLSQPEVMENIVIVASSGVKIDTDEERNVIII